MIISGCNNNNFENKYIKETDSQYMYINELFPSNIVSSEEGYYIASGAYIYYVDKETKKQTILCNKPNCLHDEERDITKKYNCNAFLSTPGRTLESINYYKGDIYAISNFNPIKKSDVYSLLKISKDGSSRKVIYEFDNMISAATVHRGYLYYTSNYLEDNGKNEGVLTSKNTKLLRININKKNPKPEMLYDTNLFEDGITSMIAYGKNIYFSSYGYEEKELKNYKSKLIKYDIEKNDTKEILTDYNKGEIGKVSIYDGNLLYSYWHYNDQDERNKQMYICNLDGQDSRPFIKVDFFGLDDSDDKFIFVDNIVKMISDKADKRIIEFYDGNGKKVDVLDLGKDKFISKAWAILPGDNEYLFLIYNDENNFNIKTINKKDIGSNDIKINDFFKVKLENIDNEISF